MAFNKKGISRRRDLNPGPGDYESPALPAEPRRQSEIKSENLNLRLAVKRINPKHSS